MIFGGIQKLTLLDYPEKMAATIFTQGCNFRCPFCYNSSLLPLKAANSQISEAEIVDFLKKRRGLLDGICISGGEPLLQKGIGEFIALAKELGYLVKLDTNGNFPDKLKELVGAGLVDYVAMDIKNSQEKYPQTVGIADYDIKPVEKSVEYLLGAPIDYEFRTTIVKELHEPQDMAAIGKWLQGAKKYYLQSFSSEGDVLKDGLNACSDQELNELLAIAKIYIPNAEIRGQ